MDRNSWAFFLHQFSHHGLIPCDPSSPELAGQSKHLVVVACFRSHDALPYTWGSWGVEAKSGKIHPDVELVGWLSGGR